MRLVADRLLHALTGAPGWGTRLIVIGEAQNLNRDCFEYLRHVHDDPATRFALLFDGGDGCWEVLARESMDMSARSSWCSATTPTATRPASRTRSAAWMPSAPERSPGSCWSSPATPHAPTAR